MLHPSSVSAGRRAAHRWPAAIVVALSVSASAAVAQPATAPALTLDSVYALVAARSPRAQAAGARARAAEARVPGASRPADPELQLGVMNRTLPGLAPDATLGMTQLQLMQMVPLPGRLAAAGGAARARADAARARAADVAWEARSAAAMAFYERYEADGAVAIARATRRLLEDVAAVASAMYRVGDGRQADVLRARVEIARMDEEVVRMGAMLDGATARLAAAADTSPDAVAGAPVLPAFPDSVPSLETLEHLAVETRPMLAAGAADVRAAAADATLARRELWPDVTVGVQYGQRRMAMGTDRMGSLMVGASLPIFARSRQFRMREETAAMRAMAEAELTAMRADTRSRLAEVRAALASARRLRALYRTTVLPQAEAATSSSLASYRTGSVDFMTVIDNRMGVNRYRQELLALDAAEGRAWAELEMLVGRPLLPPSDPAPARVAGGTR
ncbi:MAG: TolC family protein [Gemmatirosa sp.]